MKEGMQKFRWNSTDFVIFQVTLRAFSAAKDLHTDGQEKAVSEAIRLLHHGKDFAAVSRFSGEVGI